MSNTLKTITVSPKDDLQAVFDGAPEYADIHLLPGTYRQKVVIRTKGLTITGSGADQTRLVWDDHAKKRDQLGAEWNTFRTYSLAVCADGVTMRELSVENDALEPEKKGQEVALSVIADGFSMENCRLSSTQDTLFLGPLPSDLIGRYEGFLNDGLRRYGSYRSRFTNCYIEGTIDFIFGCGNALFERCVIHSRMDVRGVGYVAAPAHEPWQQEGFVFESCDLTADEQVKQESVYLARPWRDMGMTVFRNCVYGPHIAAEGFDKWSGTNRDRTARFYEIPPVPGRVPWCNRDAVQEDKK